MTDMVVFALCAAGILAGATGMASCAGAARGFFFFILALLNFLGLIALLGAILPALGGLALFLGLCLSFAIGWKREGGAALVEKSRKTLRPFILFGAAVALEAGLILFLRLGEGWGSAGFFPFLGMPGKDAFIEGAPFLALGGVLLFLALLGAATMLGPRPESGKENALDLFFSILKSRRDNG